VKRALLIVLAGIVAIGSGSAAEASVAPDASWDGGGAASTAVASSTDHAFAGAPKLGYYQGQDAKRQPIRFYLTDHGGQLHLSTFMLDNVELGRADLKDNAFAQRHHCLQWRQDYCAHGHWTSHDQVAGGWHYRTGVANIPFKAHWVHEWHEPTG